VYLVKIGSKYSDLGEEMAQLFSQYLVRISQEPSHSQVDQKIERLTVEYMQGKISHEDYRQQVDALKRRLDLRKIAAKLKQ
jgi:polyhydroxyalkanoate synthesis regulator phasin